MTDFTKTVAEVIYSMPASGAALSNSTTNTVLTGNTSTNPAFELPTPLWQPAYFVGKALHVLAKGTFGTTGTPTLTIGCYVDPTQNSTASQQILAATGALTTPSGVTNGNWELEFTVSMQSIGVTSSAYTATWNTSGTFKLGAGNNAATTAASVYMVGNPQTTIAVNPMAINFLEIWATWGTASASNTITCSQFMVLGLN